jgi:hypothetical protein
VKIKLDLYFIINSTKYKVERYMLMQTKDAIQKSSILLIYQFQGWITPYQILPVMISHHSENRTYPVNLVINYTYAKVERYVLRQL